MSAGLSTDQWKRTLDDYVASAKALHASMVDKGFDPAWPIPVDPDGELLGGAHRLACAMALGIESVAVTHSPGYVWAPAWGVAWFTAAGMAHDDLMRLTDDWIAFRR
jgi:hypothetical protein